MRISVHITMNCRLHRKLLFFGVDRMDNVNKTLYIPLYGKAFVSRKNIILKDKKAEEIWEKEKFPLKGKSKSKWLAYYMGMRSAVFDRWVNDQMSVMDDSVVIHLGCGMDSRIDRIEQKYHIWYDVDFPEVIKERKRYFFENANYHMLSADVRNPDWLRDISENRNAIIVVEGVSMYISTEDLKMIMRSISDHFSNIHILMDCYSVFAAKMSAVKNPINDVGGAVVYGMGDPTELEDNTGISFVKEHEITPHSLIDELHGIEKVIFKKLYAGKISRKTYRLYEFMKTSG